MGGQSFGVIRKQDEKDQSRIPVRLILKQEVIDTADHRLVIVCGGLAFRVFDLSVYRLF